MSPKKSTALVTTIEERCRTCYTCVRECPAKAIRIIEGQASVIAERCIGCGNCVRVCSQNAKQVLSALEDVCAMLDSGKPVAACVAPSFPAEFGEVEPLRVVGALRALGFQSVYEVAFGADLVADRYRRLLAETRGGPGFISTPCPAVISYVERYHPGLVARLAPVVSPMVAMARVIRAIQGPDVKVVFVGPCIAKKGEALDANLPGEVDAVLTYVELRALFRKRALSPDRATRSDFDPPHGGLGALFPVSRGLLQAAELREDLMAGDVLTAEGRTEFVDAIRAFESGDLKTGLLEILCCTGCIMGAGMTCDVPLFRRRSAVAQYVQQRMKRLDPAAWRAALRRFGDLDLSRRFTPADERIPAPSEETLLRILAEMGKFSPTDELNCGACGYESCREHAIAIYRGLAEKEMCLPHTIDHLRKAMKELDVSHERLASVQDALMRAEKLASMGQLAAGIAHEINNPLGVVLMLAHVLREEFAREGRSDEDLDLIVEQADRCKKIVSGLLHFARQNKVVRQPTNMVELVDSSLKVIPRPDNIVVTVEHALADPIADVDRDQLIQVLTNLISNAKDAMPAGGTLTVRTSGDEDAVKIAVADTGVGIDRQTLGKIFEPFFTTKQIGKGTGLGLAVTYGIVKMHRGDIQVTTNADPTAGPTGSVFTVRLPRHETLEPSAEPLLVE